jgi:hypothetical protein
MMISIDELFITTRLFIIITTRFLAKQNRWLPLINDRSAIGFGTIEQDFATEGERGRECHREIQTGPQ